MVQMGLMDVLQQGRRRACGLSEDGAAQASFAMIAVAILIASSAAGVLMMKKELEERERARHEADLVRMAEVVADVSRELELVGVAKAHEVVSGESVVELLRWLVFSMATFVVNLGRANNPIAYPSLPPAFFEALFVRFEVLLEVGLPKMMRAIGAVGDLDARYVCALAVYPNLPAIGKLAGKSWGAWSVGFGAYLEGVPREFVEKFLSKTSGDRVDFWVFKARLRGI